MLKWFRKVESEQKSNFREFRTKALLLARIMRACKGVDSMALTGSLARDEENPKDIDLIVFNSSDYNFTVHINHEDGRNSYWDNAPDNSADRLASFFSPGLQQAVLDVCDETMADLIFIDSRALASCEYLLSLAKVESTKDFYRRLLCELPMREYRSRSHDFADPLKHRDGQCCFPEKTYAMVKAERNKPADEPHGSVDRHSTHSSYYS